MNDTPPKLTRADLEIGRIYCGILIEQARSGETLSYGDLVAKAKARQPDNQYVQRAIAVSAGRRLEAVRRFTSERGYPDITSLVVNAATGEVGAAAFGTDPVARRAEIEAFDWSRVDEQFDVFLSDRRAELPSKRKRVPAADARRMIWEFYSANKATLPENVVADRDGLQKMVMDGHAVADAFERIVFGKPRPSDGIVR